MRWRIPLFICSVFFCSQNLVSQDALALTPPMGCASPKIAVGGEA
jgi:hypothetical protein